MKKTIFFLASLFFLLSLSAQNQEEGLKAKKIQAIAFGSCSKQDLVEKQLWDEINNEKPDLWIWLGDNIYGDSEDPSVLKEKYQKQKSHPGYQALTQSTDVIGIWDDHDYGVNDGGREFPKKDESRDLMFEFLDLDPEHPAWKRKGGYQAHTYDFGGKRIKILLLDARYFRDPLKKDGDNNNIPDYEGEILGDEQWDWLTIQLNDRETDLFIVGSGIQVLAKDHRFEKWANFPSERNRLFDLIKKKVQAPLLFLSGDRHISELSMLNIADHQYPLYDLTSSSLTHGWKERRPEENEYRFGQIIYDENFGLLTIDWANNRANLQLKYITKGNKVVQEFDLVF